MDKPTYVYVTYIRSTAAKVWQALTDGEVTRKYWSDHRNASNWTLGSTWKHEDANDPSIVDVVGTVVETDPPRHLVITWAAPNEANDPKRVSRVTFEIVEDGDMVRLTVTHEDLEPDVLKGISSGWPIVLSGLKTLLETGKPLASIWKRDGADWNRLRFADAV
jgi:uncharacterized protein YndB with AHSA1/START domain